MQKEYQLAFTERYSSEEMMQIFSPLNKFTTWRKLWIYLAESQQKLGLKITDAQINEMKRNINKFDDKYIKNKEKELRHDVMAHIHGFCKECPKAAPIIHLGATSAYVGDNTDLIQIKDALHIIKNELLQVIDNIKQFSIQYKDDPVLGFTHFQPAQLTTIGKRASLWLQDFIIDYYDLEHLIDTLPFRGVKGTTGTQASFMKLFNNNSKKVEKLDQAVTSKAGFKKRFLVTGQTYTRKIDARVCAVLSSISQSAAKFSNDIRLLQHKKEMEEPFEKKQVGSSAMAYKRNPMRSERISSIARFVMSLEQSCAYTASTQWFERTLDDSANKRLAIPQAFLGTDAILLICANITSNLVVYPKVVEKHIMEELPFIITENIIMQGVAKGGNRQKLHEKIRQLSMEASRNVKEKGLENNLIDLIAADKDFKLSKEELNKLLIPSLYTGRSAEQVKEFIEKEVQPVLKNLKRNKKLKTELKV